MRSKQKILIVEDNQVNLELFMDLLNVGGYECLHTTKGEEALDIAKRERPDLVLLDIQLPNMDGLTVGKLLKLHDETKNIKAIALTAYAMKGDKEMFLEQGFDGYISKPIKIKEFIDTIKGFLKDI
jgi:two-component system cell cycle response regulator DivK